MVGAGVQTLDSNEGAPGSLDAFIAKRLKGDARRVLVSIVDSRVKAREVVKALLPARVKNSHMVFYTDCRCFRELRQDRSLHTHWGRTSWTVY